MSRILALFLALLSVAACSISSTPVNDPPNYCCGSDQDAASADPPA